MISATMITDEKAGVTICTLEIDGVAGVEDNLEIISLVETGSARCMGEDDLDFVVGDKLALGRALQAAGEELEREAYAVVHERDRERERRLRATQELVERKRAHSYKFQCEFAELINLKLAEKSAAVADDTVPDTRFQTTGSVLRDAVNSGKKKKARKKAHQIREDLPA